MQAVASCTPTPVNERPGTSRPIEVKLLLVRWIARLLNSEWSA